VAITAQSDLADVCFEVCTALDRAGITAVLTGGSAATFYAPEAYQSRDADFIITRRADGGAKVLADLGYSGRGGTYEHAENPYTLEFPRGPLAVGDDLIKRWETIRRKGRILHVLSRTDCVRDRLMWFYTSNDRTALRAAIGVAGSGPVNQDLVREWSLREGYTKEWDYFFTQIENAAP
jgi:hypothetical protein